MNKIFIPLMGFAFLQAACNNGRLQENAKKTAANAVENSEVVKPLYVTEPVQFDTDDPAVWINPQNKSASLVVGTDKSENGALYVFDLKGKIKSVVKDLKRPNNVDIAYGLQLNGKSFDIAITSERLTHKLRIFSLPDMKPIDKGGIDVYVGETGAEYRDLMGIATYKNKKGQLYAIVGRKNGPRENYLWQYLLEDDGSGNVKATLVRKFGKYSGKKEIEAIAVDNELGFVYYSDEQFGVRQYYADPEKGNQELALFGKTDFAEDHEGISIYKTSDSTGYIVISDQGANRFQIFQREGTQQEPFNHKLMKIVNVEATQSDGSEMISTSFNDDFKHGLFVVMSDNKTFHYYRWEDIAGKTLKINQ